MEEERAVQTPKLNGTTTEHNVQLENGDINLKGLEEEEEQQGQYSAGASFDYDNPEDEFPEDMEYHQEEESVHGSNMPFSYKMENDLSIKHITPMAEQEVELQDKIDEHDDSNSEDLVLETTEHIGHLEKEDNNMTYVSKNPNATYSHSAQVDIQQKHSIATRDSEDKDLDNVIDKHMELTLIRNDITSDAP